jgi:hypothetical protein
MKALIVILLLAVLAALASAGVLMLRTGRAKDPKGARMARALAVRVGLSITVFLLVLFSYWMGWIQPTGIPVSG